MSELNLTKYENVVLYLCGRIASRTISGKKKLAKLLYYVDFDRFEFNESMETVTGDEFKRLPMGPYPQNMTKVIDGMAARGLLEAAEVQEYADFNKTHVYRAIAEPDLSVFSEEDLIILERVARIYLPLTGRQLEDRSHIEAPWLAVEHTDVIPFELAFYRETDFADAA